MRGKYFFFITIFVFVASALFFLGFSSNIHAQAEKGTKTYKKMAFRKIKRLPGWKVYKKLCADCHGEKGDGKGPLGETMNPAPANYQNCDVLGKITDDEIKKVILEGTAAIGKSKAMQGFKNKIKDPLVLDQLVEVVRSFGGCNYNPPQDKSGS